MNKLPNSPLTKTPKGNNTKTRGPGRPPRSRTVAETTQGSPVTEPKDEGLKQSSFEVIIECLQKLNNRNKVLSNRVVELDSKVQEQDKKIDELSAKLASSPNVSESVDSREINKVTD